MMMTTMKIWIWMETVKRYEHYWLKILKFFVRSICIRQITMFCCYLLILANHGK